MHAMPLENQERGVHEELDLRPDSQEPVPTTHVALSTPVFAVNGYCQRFVRVQHRSPILFLHWWRSFYVVISVEEPGQKKKEEKR